MHVHLLSMHYLDHHVVVLSRSSAILLGGRRTGTGVRCRASREGVGACVNCLVARGEHRRGFGEG